MTYEERIDFIAQILSQLGIPYTKHALWDGWQLRFGWSSGDIACHSGTYEHDEGMVESYMFPWDDGDCTPLCPDDAAIMIIAHYAKWMEMKV